ncbi:ABC transporter permease [Nakamurella sp. A5-74]|uniref:ABC transporter permease n=1 Tax=Nakamurella sp. A5-74 TaxID=3158264 RepID=A0AAU8DT14_9ACTN
MSTTPSLSKPDGPTPGKPVAAGSSPVSGPSPGVPRDEELSGNLFSNLFKRQTTWIFLVLVVLVVFFGIQSGGRFSTASNFLLISQNVAVLAVIAVGMTFVIITSGIDLSVGSVLVFASVVSAKVMSSMADSNGPGLVILVGVLVAVFTGAAWGLINGFLVAKAKVPPLIVTLGTLSASLGLAQVISKGVDIPIGKVQALTDFGIYQRILGVPALVVVALVILVIGGVVLHKTKFGRYTYAIGSNEEASRRVGIKVDRHLILIYLYTGALAGVGAVMFLAQFTTTSIAGGTQTNLNVITAVVIGGTSIFGGLGTMFGTVVGLFIPAVLQSGLVIIGVQSFWQLVAVGAVLVAAVYVDQTRRKAALRGSRTSTPFGKRAGRKVIATDK